jgi:hypothetical protein
MPAVHGKVPQPVPLALVQVQHVDLVLEQARFLLQRLQPDQQRGQRFLLV